MPRIVQMLLFALVGTTVNAGMHWYIWSRLVRDSRLPAPWPKVLAGVLIAMAVVLPVSMVLSRQLGAETAKWFAFPAYVWMGTSFILTMLLFGSGMARWVGEVFLKVFKLDEELKDPERRLAIQQAFAATAAVTVTAVSGYGVMRQARGAQVKDVDVTLARLPASMDGTTLVQMTDIHVGPTIGRDYILDLVRKTNELKPDIIALTGDLVDGSVEDLRRAVEPLKDLVAKHGVYFVSGNHEYFSGADEWAKELERLGIHLLRNERAVIGDGAASFDLAGVHDYSAGRFGDEPDLQKALAGRDASRELILLAHQPREFSNAVAQGVGLQLSGHTHGGQIWPWNFAVKLQTPFVEGFYRDGASQLYVSPGTGYWGPPMRVGTTAEITRLTLRSVDRLA